MSKNKQILSSNPSFNFNVKLQQLDKLRFCIDDLQDAIFICRPSKSINNKSPYLCDICLSTDIENDQCKKISPAHCPQLDANQQMKKDVKLLVKQKSSPKSQFSVLFHQHNNIFICSLPLIAEQQFLFFFQDFIISKQTTLSFSGCLPNSTLFSQSFLQKNAKLKFDFVLQQKLKDGVGEETYTTGPLTFVETKNVIIADGDTAKFPYNDKPKKFGDLKVISIRCIKQAFLIMKFLQSQKDSPPTPNPHHFAFVFLVNRSDVNKFLLSDPLFSDLLFNCLLLGCSITAYRIKWNFSNSRAISSISKTLPIQFQSKNINFTCKPFQKITNSSKLHLIQLDEHSILKNIFHKSS